jgi:hypothetical protein
MWTKFGHLRSKGSKVIADSDGQTDRQTDGQTDKPFS